MSLRIKLTLWFGAALTIMVTLTIGVMIFAESSVLHGTVRDSVIDAVEDNYNGIEFYKSLEELYAAFPGSDYIPYNGGFIRVGSNFTSHSYGVNTGLYSEDGELIYGENPMGGLTAEMHFENSVIRIFGKGRNACYVFDRRLTGEGFDGLWLRGTALQHQRSGELSALVKLAMVVLPLLLVIAVFGGYIISVRALRPIKKMSEAAEAISGGNDLKKRIDVGDGKDELHRLAASFNMMIDRLDYSFETEKRFTSDVSHELRTPVAVISAQCDFSLEEERSAEEYIEALTAIRRQSAGMNRMISDMLDFVRIERNTETYAMEQLDLSGLVRAVCEELSVIGERGIGLVTDIQDNITFRGNDRLLVRMITNLIGNAYRYGKENGNITVTLCENEYGIILKVIDDGIGISSEHIPKIFNRFFRADESRNSKGTGLGLPMAKEIANLHGGEIAVKSELSKGSEFAVFFLKK